MNKDQITSFDALPVEKRLLDAILAKGFSTPTPIQSRSIPEGLHGKDILGIAQTGTGKTLAFGIPMLDRLIKHGGRGLVIVPTRELAEQVSHNLQSLAAAVGLRQTVFIGGASMHLQRMSLRQNPRILIATPGRLIDHLKSRTVTLREVSVLVLDEADRMLDMGFAPQLKEILRHVPTERQTMLFSATMPSDITAMANSYMKNPVRIEVAPAGTATELVEQAVLVLRHDQKQDTLLRVLSECKGSVLVFMRTKHGAKKMTKTLVQHGFTAAEIHSNRTLAQRRVALAGFKDRKSTRLNSSHVSESRMPSSA